MRITVHIYAYLRQYLQAPERRALEKEWDLPDRATVQYVLEKLHFPEGVRVTALLNNQSVDKTTILKEGDVVHVLPPMGGG